MDANEACTLPTVDRPLRIAQFDELFAASVRDVRRAEPSRLSLRLTATPEVASRTAELVAKETACCSFFSFTLTATAGALSLDIAVPAAHIAVLDAMAVRAERGTPK